MMISDQIRKAIFEAVKLTHPEVGLKLEDIFLEHPAAEEHGDYSTNIALRVKGKGEKGKGPREIAEKIAEQITTAGPAGRHPAPTSSPAKGEAAGARAGAPRPSPAGIFWDKVEVAGPARLDSMKPSIGDIVEKVEAKRGFINFWLSPEWLVREVGELAENYGQSEQLIGKKIMVEFAHPNTHKQFHIGHLRNITLGESIARLLEASGANVVRANYQGDVGMHVAKAIYGVRKLTSEYKAAKKADVAGRVTFLGKVYVLGSQVFETDQEAKKEIAAINKKIYQKDPEIMPLWQETRKWSLDYFDGIYKRVYTEFDRLYLESEVADRGKELVLQNVGKVFEKSDGAIVFRGKHTRVFINSEGNPTYEAKDMGLGELQFKEYHPDLILHNVGPEQAGYFEVVFAALAEIFPETKGREFHNSYGWVRLKEGKMSSRSGVVVLGEWLLDQVKKKLGGKYPDRVSDLEPIAVAAVKYSLLKVGSSQEIAFDIDESINLEGDSGPYLQYTYARARSVIRKWEVGNGRLDSEVGSETQSRESHIALQVPASHIARLTSEELAVLRYLYRFPEVVEQAAKNYAPNLVCSYLFELAKRFNNFYNQVPIIQGDKGSRGFRLSLTAATAQVLKNGLDLLGIQALERM